VLNKLQNMDITSNQLVPELSVTNFQASLHFYTNILGFSIAYQREEEGFAFLTLENVQIMIDELGKGRDWKTAEFNYPLGRGINFQIEVQSIDPILSRLKQANINLFLEVEEKWYRKDDHEVGSRQFLVQDPDGYLLRFAEDLGRKALVN
jgi:catechol 2,3-dioxygenase-like lactoylglutathione lyase family enzyme